MIFYVISFFFKDELKKHDEIVKMMNLEKQNLINSRDDLTNEVEKHLAELQSLKIDIKLAKVIKNI